MPSLVGTAMTALLCNLALELVRLAGVGDYPWRHKTPAFVLMFLLGSLVLWVLVGLVHAVVGRLRVTVAVAATATALVALVDYEKVRVRREPLYPSDWRFAGDVGFLKDMIGPRVVLLMVAGAIVAVVAFVASRLARRRLAPGGPKERHPWPARTRAALRLVTVTACLLSLGYISDFNSPGNAARGTYEALGATWMPWSQQRNYLGNGFVGGFLYNLQAPAMTRPEGYSTQAMARIAARYRQAAERINRTRDPDAMDDVNVVMVLSESFSDPEALAGVHLADDPIPFTRRLMASTTSGAMLAKGYGGGTANMEFEALTGMSMSQFPPQMQVPYNALVPRYDRFPSAVEWFEQRGYRAVAIHPFTTEMYRRRDVYRTFGFDDFVYDRRMHDQSRLGHDAFISDAAAFGEVQRQIEAEDDPLFVNLVSMQNHMPYTDRYDDPIEATDDDGETLTELGQYARGLAYTDHAVRRLIRRLRRSDEKTVVVFYGDHLPGFYPDSVFEANRARALHETPFFVWSNFPGADRAQPTTSPNHFVDLVLGHVGAEVSPYYALLHRLRQDVPAMDAGLVIDDRDSAVRADRLSPRAIRLLHDYRLVQYDLSVGERLSEERMFAPVR
jgi:phosphoglycerol transferase MdoB-like AlkP superfamily enzyme